MLLMTNDQQTWLIFGFLFGIAFLIAVIVLAIKAIRWLFRVDETAAYLKRIADKLDPPVGLFCESCHKNFPPDALVKIDSGQSVCLDCKRIISRKSLKCDWCGKEFISMDLKEVKPGKFACRGCGKIINSH